MAEDEVREVVREGVDEQGSGEGAAPVAEASPGEAASPVLAALREALIAAKLGDPRHDPHGHPIPTAELEIERDETQSLASLEAGQSGTFVRVSDADPEMLRYLADRGIAPGARIEVTERQPFGGPLFVRAGDTEHALGGALAEAMRIDVDEREDRR